MLSPLPLPPPSPPFLSPPGTHKVQPPMVLICRHCSTFESCAVTPCWFWIQPSRLMSRLLRKLPRQRRAALLPGRPSSPTCICCTMRPSCLHCTSSYRSVYYPSPYLLPQLSSTCLRGYLVLCSKSIIYIYIHIIDIYIHIINIIHTCM